MSGSYHVQLPDGRVQVVTYTADEKGYRAEITYLDRPTNIGLELTSPTYNLKETSTEGYCTEQPRKQVLIEKEIVPVPASVKDQHLKQDSTSRFRTNYPTLPVVSESSHSKPARGTIRYKMMEPVQSMLQLTNRTPVRIVHQSNTTIYGPHSREEEKLHLVAETGASVSRGRESNIHSARSRGRERYIPHEKRVEGKVIASAQRSLENARFVNLKVENKDTKMRGGNIHVPRSIENRKPRILQLEDVEKRSGDIDEELSIEADIQNVEDSEENVSREDSDIHIERSRGREIFPQNEKRGKEKVETLIPERPRSIENKRPQRVEDIGKRNGNIQVERSIEGGRTLKAQDVKDQKINVPRRGDIHNIERSRGRERFAHNAKVETRFQERPRSIEINRRSRIQPVGDIGKHRGSIQSLHGPRSFQNGRLKAQQTLESIADIASKDQEATRSSHKDYEKPSRTLYDRLRPKITPTLQLSEAQKTLDVMSNLNTFTPPEMMHSNVMHGKQDEPQVVDEATRNFNFPNLNRGNVGYKIPIVKESEEVEVDTAVLVSSDISSYLEEIKDLLTEDFPGGKNENDPVIEEHYVSISLPVEIQEEEANFSGNSPWQETAELEFTSRGHLSEPPLLEENKSLDLNGLDLEKKRTEEVAYLSDEMLWQQIINLSVDDSLEETLIEIDVEKDRTNYLTQEKSAADNSITSHSTIILIAIISVILNRYNFF